MGGYQTCSMQLSHQVTGKMEDKGELEKWSGVLDECSNKKCDVSSMVKAQVMITVLVLSVRGRIQEKKESSTVKSIEKDNKNLLFFVIHGESICMWKPCLCSEEQRNLWKYLSCSCYVKSNQYII